MMHIKGLTPKENNLSLKGDHVNRRRIASAFALQLTFMMAGHRDDGESGAGLPVGLGLSESMAGKKVNTMGTGGDETRFSGSYFFL